MTYCRRSSKSDLLEHPETLWLQENGLHQGKGHRHRVAESFFTAGQKNKQKNCWKHLQFMWSRFISQKTTSAHFSCVCLEKWENVCWNVSLFCWRLRCQLYDGWKQYCFYHFSGEQDDQLALIFHLSLIPLILLSKCIDFYFFVGILEVGSHRHPPLCLYFTTTRLLINPFPDACEWQTGPSMKFFMNHTIDTAQTYVTTDRWEMDCGYRNSSAVRRSPLRLYSYSNQYGCLVKNKQFLSLGVHKCQMMISLLCLFTLSF